MTGRERREGGKEDRKKGEKTEGRLELARSTISTQAIRGDNSTTYIIVMNNVPALFLQVFLF